MLWDEVEEDGPVPPSRFPEVNTHVGALAEKGHSVRLTMRDGMRLPRSITQHIHEDAAQSSFPAMSLVMQTPAYKARVEGLSTEEHTLLRCWEAFQRHAVPMNRHDGGLDAGDSTVTNGPGGSKALPSDQITAALREAYPPVVQADIDAWMERHAVTRDEFFTWPEFKKCALQVLAREAMLEFDIGEEHKTNAFHATATGVTSKTGSTVGASANVQRSTSQGPHSAHALDPYGGEQSRLLHTVAASQPSTGASKHQNTTTDPPPLTPHPLSPMSVSERARQRYAEQQHLSEYTRAGLAHKMYDLAMPRPVDAYSKLWHKGTKAQTVQVESQMRKRVLDEFTHKHMSEEEKREVEEDLRVVMKQVYQQERAALQRTRSSDALAETERAEKAKQKTELMKQLQSGENVDDSNESDSVVEGSITMDLSSLKDMVEEEAAAEEAGSQQSIYGSKSKDEVDQQFKDGNLFAGLSVFERLHYASLGKDELFAATRPHVSLGSRSLYNKDQMLPSMGTLDPWTRARAIRKSESRSISLRRARKNACASFQATLHAGQRKLVAQHLRERKERKVETKHAQTQWLRQTEMRRQQAHAILLHEEQERKQLNVLQQRQELATAEEQQKVDALHEEEQKRRKRRDALSTKPFGSRWVGTPGLPLPEDALVDTVSHYFEEERATKEEAARRSASAEQEEQEHQQQQEQAGDSTETGARSAAGSAVAAAEGVVQQTALSSASDAKHTQAATVEPAGPDPHSESAVDLQAAPSLSTGEAGSVGKAAGVNTDDPPYSATMSALMTDMDLTTTTEMPLTADGRRLHTGGPTVDPANILYSSSPTRLQPFSSSLVEPHPELEDRRLGASRYSEWQRAKQDSDEREVQTRARRMKHYAKVRRMANEMAWLKRSNASLSPVVLDGAEQFGGWMALGLPFLKVDMERRHPSQQQLDHRREPTAADVSIAMSASASSPGLLQPSMSSSQSPDANVVGQIDVFSSGASGGGISSGPSHESVWIAPPADLLTRVYASQPPCVMDPAYLWQQEFLAANEHTMQNMTPEQRDFLQQMQQASEQESLSQQQIQRSESQHMHASASTTEPVSGRADGAQSAPVTTSNKRPSHADSGSVSSSVSRATTAGEENGSAATAAPSGSEKSVGTASGAGGSGVSAGGSGSETSSHRRRRRRGQFSRPKSANTRIREKVARRKGPKAYTYRPPLPRSSIRPEWQLTEPVKDFATLSPKLSRRDGRGPPYPVDPNKAFVEAGACLTSETLTADSNKGEDMSLRVPSVMSDADAAAAAVSPNFHIGGHDGFAGGQLDSEPLTAGTPDNSVTGADDTQSQTSQTSKDDDARSLTFQEVTAGAELPHEHEPRVGLATIDAIPARTDKTPMMQAADRIYDQPSLQKDSADRKRIVT